jgi:hypothetical protein
MTELVLYYVLPNVALFGGLYLLATAIEKLTWKFIIRYCDEYEI